MAKEDYFVKIQNPIEIRRNILENTRDVLKILQGYEDFKRIREKASSLLHAFKKDVSEARAMVQGLRKILPKMDVKFAKKPAIAKQEAQKAPKELKKLEQELSDIEEKLSNL